MDGSQKYHNRVEVNLLAKNRHFSSHTLADTDWSHERQYRTQATRLSPCPYRTKGLFQRNADVQLWLCKLTKGQMMWCSRKNLATKVFMFAAGAAADVIPVSCDVLRTRRSRIPLIPDQQDKHLSRPILRMTIPARYARIKWCSRHSESPASASVG